MLIATREFRRKQLVISLSAVLAAGAGSASHAESSAALSGALPFLTSSVTRNVNSCLDNGAVGTFRQVVGIAASGDTVDLSGVPVSCSTITLTMGEIAIGQSTLIISGPTTRTLTIVNSQVGRILHHTATGILDVNYLTLSNALVYTTSNPAKGGCIYSTGNVVLSNTTLTGCVAKANAGVAVGGAIFAAGYVDMNLSRITGSSAYAYDDSPAAGGGVYAQNGLHLSYSTISGNATFNLGNSSSGGGAYVSGGNVTILYSTIDANYAGFGAGIAAKPVNFLIKNSTVSGNTAKFNGGGIEITSLSGLGVAGVYNSTIAFNTAAVVGGVGGIYARASVGANSSIIANNGNKSTVPFADLYIQGAGNTLIGQNSLIMASNLALLGTVTSDPMLTPLAARGGATRTHGLSLRSPAIDNGAYDVLDANDQRGPGFPRVVPAGKADIGAYERQANDDELFYGGFD